MYKQRDIVMLPVSYTNQYEREYRPAIIISNELVNATQDCLVMPIKTHLRSDKLGFRLMADELVSPLQFESEVRLHKVMGVEKRFIKKKASELSEAGFERLISQFEELIKA